MGKGYIPSREEELVREGVDKGVLSKWMAMGSERG